MTDRLASAQVVEFVGDLHLGDGGRNDAFGSNDGVLTAFLRRCQEQCDTVVFMGDAFDLPQAWSIRRIARAHEGVLRAIDELSVRRRVIFIRGNHDWNVPYERLFPRAVVRTELVMDEVLIMHGHRFDPYCHPDKRFHRYKIAAHNFAERLFGFEFRVPLADHDSWQNRAGHWLGHKYALYLQRMAQHDRRKGHHGKAASREDFIRYWSRAVWGDPHAMFGPVRRFLDAQTHRALVCGHSHLPGVIDVAAGRYVNAGSWAFGAAQTATWNGTIFSVHDHARGVEIGDENYRWMVDTPDPGDFFVWWRKHYRGRLRFDGFTTKDGRKR